MLVLFMKTQFSILFEIVYLHKLFEFETAKQPGFEPGSPGPKAATLTIELHSIDHLKDVC